MIVRSLNGSFKPDVLHRFLTGYVSILGVDTINDARLLKCRSHADNDGNSLDDGCSCPLIRLLKVLQQQSGHGQRVAGILFVSIPFDAIDLRLIRNNLALVELCARLS